MEKEKNQTSAGVEEQVSADSLAFGDVIYVKLSKGSWWPAQVVDAKRLPCNVKLTKHCPEHVLVRIYGSYTYIYVDPIKSFSEFKMVLRNNNGDLKKILEEALIKDLPSTKKSSKAKGLGTPSKKSGSKRKFSGEDGGSQSREAASGKPQELSSRRIRVMESLGLVAPAGSPFSKHAPN